MERRRLEGLLASMPLPFGFGAPPDRFEKGVLVRDLPVETCRQIISKMRRLGGDLEAVLRLRMAEKTNEMTAGQRKAARSQA